MLYCSNHVFYVIFHLFATYFHHIHACPITYSHHGFHRMHCVVCQRIYPITHPCPVCWPLTIMSSCSKHMIYILIHLFVTYYHYLFARHVENPHRDLIRTVCAWSVPYCVPLLIRSCPPAFRLTISCKYNVFMCIMLLIDIKVCISMHVIISFCSGQKRVSVIPVSVPTHCTFMTANINSCCPVELLMFIWTICVHSTATHHIWAYWLHNHIKFCVIECPMWSHYCPFPIPSLTTYILSLYASPWPIMHSNMKINVFCHYSNAYSYVQRVILLVSHHTITCQKLTVFDFRNFRSVTLYDLRYCCIYAQPLCIRSSHTCCRFFWHIRWCFGRCIRLPRVKFSLCQLWSYFRTCHCYHLIIVNTGHRYEVNTLFWSTWYREDAWHSKHWSRQLVCNFSYHTPSGNENFQNSENSQNSGTCHFCDSTSETCSTRVEEQANLRCHSVNVKIGDGTLGAHVKISYRRNF